MLRALAWEERNVGQMAEELEITPAVASHHLRVLEGAGFLHRRRRERWVSYRLDRERLRWGIVKLLKYLRAGGKRDEE